MEGTRTPTENRINSGPDITDGSTNIALIYISDEIFVACGWLMANKQPPGQSGGLNSRAG